MHSEYNVFMVHGLLSALRKSLISRIKVKVEVLVVQRRVWSDKCTNIKTKIVIIDSGKLGKYIKIAFFTWIFMMMLHC